MNTLHKIENKINELKIDNSKLMESLNILHGQLLDASNSDWTRSELGDYLKSENDILDSDDFNQETQLFEDIRNIQDEIINYFGNDES